MVAVKDQAPGECDYVLVIHFVVRHCDKDRHDGACHFHYETNVVNYQLSSGVGVGRHFHLPNIFPADGKCEEEKGTCVKDENNILILFSAVFIVATLRLWPIFDGGCPFQWCCPSAEVICPWQYVVSHE